jgi:ParB family chromosome partitioning protein
VLDALKKGAVSLQQARLIARIPDTAKQGQMGEQALRGDNYFLYNLRGLVEAGRMTANNRLMKLVGVDAYVAAGGKIEEDLFGELPATIENPELVCDLWRARAEGVTSLLGDLELTVLFGGETHSAPDGFVSLPMSTPTTSPTR